MGSTGKWSSIVAPVTYDDAQAAVRDRLGKRGAEHCERVAATAASLATAYGVDVGLARLAGVLHDWDRDRAHGELIAAAQAAGLATTPTDAAVPYLLHARTGASGVAETFPELQPEVVQAIARHTVGARDMTPLDEVVYLADMIEPARDYPGVEELRSAVGSVSLSELFALGYQHSVMHLVRRRRPIHPETLAVWNDLVAGDPR
jgi:predicted HD superfamily hydrolase involved in NAD metabolism